MMVETVTVSDNGVKARPAHKSATYHGVNIVLGFLVRGIFGDSILIVVGTQLFVAQNIVGLAKTLKLRLSFRVIRILVWVKLLSVVKRRKGCKSTVSTVCLPVCLSGLLQRLRSGRLPSSA